MFEVALALSQAKPVVFITQGDAAKIPFDIRHHHVIRYAKTPKGLRNLEERIAATVQEVLRRECPPAEGLRQMLVPESVAQQEGPFVVAASPLSYREAFRSRGGWVERPVGTYSDQVGIRGLMQAFGLIYGLDRLPNLMNPDDFDDKILNKPAHLFCIGSPKANRWTGMMMAEFFASRKPTWEFRADPESTDLRNPKVAICTSGKAYEPLGKVEASRLVWDFGLVVRGPHPKDAELLFMAMAGRSSLGTEAACLATTDPECQAKLAAALAQRGVNLDEHRQAFCAVVSVRAKDMSAHLGADKKRFCVEDIRVY
jgi:hypothetical protein